jgi:thiol-disulfide isomerase/thioredoxin
MTTLFSLMERAGLVPLEGSQVVLPNFEFPVLMSTDYDAPPPMQPLFCRESGSQAPLATLLYFTFPGCENCRPSLKAFENLARDFSANSDQICFRAVVTDWQTQPEIAEELRSVSWRSEIGLVWDERGILQERLAVLAQPAFFLLDRDGRVVAYSNAPIEFAAPGFQVFWTVFGDLIKSEAKSTPTSPRWSQSLREENLVKSSTTVTFLNNGALSLLWLVAAIALCYSLVRFFTQLRKNFRGSQNSS